MAQKTYDTAIYWIVGGLVVVLALIAFSIWRPLTAPEDISPSAGSTSGYIDESSSNMLLRDSTSTPESRSPVNREVTPPSD